MVRSPWHRRQPLTRKRLPSFRPQVESLEDRTQPTIIFNPVFGNESIIAGSQAVGLNHQKVYVLFWGSYWGTAQGTQDQARYVNLATSILNSPYLNGVQQYGQLGPASFGGSQAITSSDPANGFHLGDLENLVQGAILASGSSLPTPFSGPGEPEYVVITPPNIQSDQANAGAYNTLAPFEGSINYHLIWNIYAGPDFAGLFFSHELAESSTYNDSNQGTAILEPSTLPPAFRGDNQIADGEPNVAPYLYRLNGADVQPYWSQTDKAYAVTDGNRQDFYLDPNWDLTTSPPTFLDTYTLTIRGDQLANPDDRLNINTNSTGGILVEENGEVASFDSGRITSIQVDLGTGNNAIAVGETTVPVTIHTAAGANIVSSAPGASVSTKNDSLPPPTTGTAANAGANFSELGAFRLTDGSWTLDSNGTPGYQPGTPPTGDRVLSSFTRPGFDTVAVSGDWTGNGRTEIGDFQDGVWHLDLNNDGTLDTGDTFFFGQAGDVPVAGNYFGDGVRLAVWRVMSNGDGVFLISDASWRTDSHITVASSFIYGAAGDHVVVGDWNGQGLTEVGVRRDASAFGAPDAGLFTLDVANHHTFDPSNKVFIFGLNSDGVVVGDWNGDGRDKLAVVRDASAFGAPGNAVFTEDTTGDYRFDANSRIFVFGLITDQFVSGKWAYKTNQPPGAATIPSAGGALEPSAPELEPGQTGLAFVADSTAPLPAAQVRLGSLANGAASTGSGETGVRGASSEVVAETSPQGDATSLAVADNGSDGTANQAEGLAEVISGSGQWPGMDDTGLAANALAAGDVCTSETDSGRS